MACQGDASTLDEETTAAGAAPLVSVTVSAEASTSSSSRGWGNSSSGNLAASSSTSGCVEATSALVSCFELVTDMMVIGKWCIRLSIIHHHYFASTNLQRTIAMAHRYVSQVGTLTNWSLSTKWLFKWSQTSVILGACLNKTDSFST